MCSLLRRLGALLFRSGVDPWTPGHVTTLRGLPANFQWLISVGYIRGFVRRPTNEKLNPNVGIVSRFLSNPCLGDESREWVKSAGSAADDRPTFLESRIRAAETDARGLYYRWRSVYYKRCITRPLSVLTVCMCGRPTLRCKCIYWKRQWGHSLLTICFMCNQKANAAYLRSIFWFVHPLTLDKSYLLHQRIWLFLLKLSLFFSPFLSSFSSLALITLNRFRIEMIYAQIFCQLYNRTM